MVAEALGQAEVAAPEGAPVLDPPGGDEARHPAAAEKRDGDPGARAPAARQPQRAHGRAIADQQLAARDRLLEPREVLEAEAPVADGVQVRLRDAVAAGDAEGSRALVEAGGDRPGEIEDLARAAHEQLPERVFVEAGAESLGEGEEDARDFGVLPLVLHGA